jgi:hypothetical protein
MQRKAKIFMNSRSQAVRLLFIAAHTLSLGPTHTQSGLGKLDGRELRAAVSGLRRVSKQAEFRTWRSG